jgi:hypothetical protein
MALRATKCTHKPTHTNIDISTKSHHHPSNKQVVLSTLVHRARALCDEDGLQVKLVFLRDSSNNGYNNRQTHRALNCHLHLGQVDNEPNSVTFLPSRVLA